LQSVSHILDHETGARGQNAAVGWGLKKIEPKVVSPERRATGPIAKREALLYVEDDDDNWLVTEMRLKRVYELARAVSAEQACQILTQRGALFSAILMDIELRGSELNGVELTELLRGKRSRSSAPRYAHGLPLLQTPIVFVTAHGAKYSDSYLLHAGGSKVIAKPVNFGELSIALTQLHLARIRER
jgi:CheY-like chemotaxis protein